MRPIQKNPEPTELEEWRARYNADINFGYELMRQDDAVCDAVERSLLEEQGKVDAYTEQRISRDDSHIEHLRPQAYCTDSEEVNYQNLVLCYPGPDQAFDHPSHYRHSPSTDEPEICKGRNGEYGAREKDNWPPPSEEHLFVSPLNDSCDERFTFTRRGCMYPDSDSDEAARRTIVELNLNHKTLKRYRKSAMEAVDDLGYRDAKRRLRKLQDENQGERTPFGAAIEYALRKHIRRLEAIRQN